MIEQLSTVTQVSRAYGVSPRMLRYYEQAGLLQSRRMPDYAYRVYDPEALQRLRQILLLRKLRVPVKDIQVILSSAEAVTAIEVFERNIADLNAEIGALSLIRHVLLRLITALQEASNLPLQHLLTLEDDTQTLLDTLTLTSALYQTDITPGTYEKGAPMAIKLKDVRIITLPPSTVASSHCVGDDPEDNAHAAMGAFVREKKLWTLKPDLRCYGFNHPNPKDETGYHGYEDWVTIPDDLEVPAPLVKKHFAGGLYAAHLIPFGNFQEWDDLLNWIHESDQYEFAGDMADQEHMCGLMEEHLNYVAFIQQANEPTDLQLDLLAPIRKKA